MKAVILAGGYGTRLSEFTDSIPKPMVCIGDKPILHHLMEYYASFGITDFVLALGYKAQLIKNYFLNYPILNSDFEIDLSTGKVTPLNKRVCNWKVTLVDTGQHTMTGGRLKRMKKILGEETFLMTYGDGLSDINIENLIKFHKRSNKMATVTAVRPSARFGELIIDGSMVTKFAEKPQTEDGWVNGGFFVLEPSFLDLIHDDLSVLEKEPLETVAANHQLAAFKHHGFWQCMDTKRDKDFLEEIWKKENCPWVVES